jgi:hypothetical protein
VLRWIRLVLVARVSLKPETGQRKHLYIACDQGSLAAPGRPQSQVIGAQRLLIAREGRPACWSKAVEKPLLQSSELVRISYGPLRKCIKKALRGNGALEDERRSTHESLKRVNVDMFKRPVWTLLLSLRPCAAQGH